MLFAAKEKGQGLVELRIDSCFDRDCCHPRLNRTRY